MNTMKSKYQEPDITLRDYVRIILVRKWIVLAFHIMTVGASIYYIKTTPPVYKATAELLYEKQSILLSLVENFHFASTSLDWETQRHIVKSPFVLKDAVDRLSNFNLISKEIDENIEWIGKNIELNSSRGSNILEISAAAESPDGAVELANTVTESYIEYIKKRKDEYFTLAIKNLEEQIETSESDNTQLLSFRESMKCLKGMPLHVTIIKEASPPKVPIKPNKKLILAIGLVLGLMLGAGLAFFLEHLDDSIKDRRDVEFFLKLPLLGKIPKIEPFDLPESALDRRGQPEGERHSEHSLSRPVVENGGENSSLPLRGYETVAVTGRHNAIFQR